MLGVERRVVDGLKAGALKQARVLGSIEPLFPRMELSVEELRAMAAGDGDKAGQQPASNQANPGGGARRRHQRRARARTGRPPRRAAIASPSTTS